MQLNNVLYYYQRSTCFGRFLRLSSGAYKTVCAAFGIVVLSCCLPLVWLGWNCFCIADCLVCRSICCCIPDSQIHCMHGQTSAAVINMPHSHSDLYRWLLQIYRMHTQICTDACYRYTICMFRYIQPVIIDTPIIFI
jgi:hypothetical protein